MTPPAAGSRGWATCYAGRVTRSPGLVLLALASLAACDRDTDANAATDHETLSCEPANAEALFEHRIGPLLSDTRPSSCNACHLQGLDLGTFAKGSPCRSMACMAQQGIVDLEQPEDSLVLRWIERADPQQRGSALITDELVAREYDAMFAWIAYSARCGAEACEPIEDPCGDEPTYEDCEGAFQPGRDEAFEDPGDCSDATLEALFAARVYSWRGRCFPCHNQDSDVDAPQWIAVGSCALGASRTLREVLDRGLVDAEHPSQSLMLLKPLSETVGGVAHGGHDKMHGVDDPAYVDFLEWIERFSACQ